MSEQTTANLPQVLAFAPLGKGGRVNLPKAVLGYLGANTLYLDVEEEIVLASQPAASSKVAEVQGKSLMLPERVVQPLGWERGTVLAMVERDRAVALKVASLVESPGEFAWVHDSETRYALTRTIYTNPMPDQSLPRLMSRHQHTRLRYDVRGYLRGRCTLPAWQARRLLGCVEPSDAVLQDQLISVQLKMPLP